MHVFNVFYKSEKNMFFNVFLIHKVMFLTSMKQISTSCRRNYVGLQSLTTSTNARTQVCQFIKVIHRASHISSKRTSYCFSILALGLCGSKFKESLYPRGEAPPTCSANLRIGWNSSHLAASGLESAVN